MKIAHITTIDLSLRYLLLNQLRFLQSAGYEVTGISAPGPDVAHLEASGIRHIAAPLTRRVTPGADLLALGRLVGILRRERFAIVHCHTPKAELLGQVAARLAGVPVVVDTFRGIPARNGAHTLSRWILVLMARLAARCADVVLSQSRANLEMAVRAGICPADKLKFLGNGIDVNHFDRRRLDAGRLARRREDLGLPQGAPVVGFVGRLVAEKGLLELMEATEWVLAQWPETRLLIVGPQDGDKADAVTPALAAEHGLDGTCVFAGMQEEMPEMYGLMDLFVLPSHRESFPRAPMEASAMGLPCVVSDIPGCREVVEPGRNGLLAPVGDARALADAMLALLGDRAEARRLGREGERLARERFDERQVFERVKAEYARLLEQKGLPTPGPTMSRKGHVP